INGAPEILLVECTTSEVECSALARPAVTEIRCRSASLRSQAAKSGHSRTHAPGARRVNNAPTVADFDSFCGQLENLPNFTNEYSSFSGCRGRYREYVHNSLIEVVFLFAQAGQMRGMEFA